MDHRAMRDRSRTETETVRRQEEGVATHPTLPRSAFLYAATHFTRRFAEDETQGPYLPTALLHWAVLAHSSRYHPRSAAVLGA